MGGEANDSDCPKGRIVNCPECEANVVAVVPEKAVPVSEERNADESVQVNCHECGDQFCVYFISKE